jgi:hypothetical protein
MGEYSAAARKYIFSKIQKTGAMKVNKRRLLIFSALLFITTLAIVYGFVRRDWEFKYYYDSRAEKIIKTAPRYVIDATFDPEKEMVFAVQTVVFQNRTPNELSEIIFHIYPEAFKSLDRSISHGRAEIRLP